MFGRSTFATKILNISYYLGVGALMPFLPVYFRLVGINAFQTGVLASSRWIIASWSGNLWVSFAQKFDHRKTVLFLSLFFGLIFSCSLVFVGNKNAFDSNVYHCEANISLTKLTGSGDLILASGKLVEDADNSSNRIDKVNHDHNSTQPTVQAKLNKTRFYNHTVTTRDSSKESMVLHRRKYSNNINETAFMISKSYLNSSSSTKVWKYPIGTFTFKRTSFTLLFLVLIGSFLSSASPTLIDKVTKDIVQQYMGRYGVYQVLQVIGTSLSVILVGLLIDSFKCSMLYFHPFDLHFCIYALFGGIATFTLLFIDIGPYKASPRSISVYRTVKFICKSFHTLVFVITLFFIGTLDSLLSNFLFWYMMDIGCSVTSMGLVVMVGSLPEIFISFKASQITNFIGHSWILFGTLFSYTFRLLYFSYVHNPWLIPVIEILHGISRPLMWNACKTYSMFIAPYGMEGTFQTIFTSLYQGLGLGIGGILTSFLYHLYGPVVVFRCTAGLCGLFCLLFAALQYILEIPERNELDFLDYEKVQQQDNRVDQGDWLLEALNAEDDVTHFTR